MPAKDDRRSSGHCRKKPKFNLSKTGQNSIQKYMDLAIDFGAVLEPPPRGNRQRLSEPEGFIGLDSEATPANRFVTDVRAGVSEAA